MNQLTFRQKLVLIAIPILLVAGMILLAFSSSRFKVTATDPAQNGKIPEFGVIILTYNKAITADNASITTSPSFTFTKAVNNTRLVLTPSDPLTNNTPYTVNIHKVCDKTHTGSCADFTLHFQVDNTLTYQGLSKDQQQQIVAQTDSQYQTAPILAILPIHDTDYLIDPKPSGLFTYIVITPNLYAEGMTEDEYTAAYAKYYQEGRDYLTGQGYPLETAHYKVVSSREFNSLTAGGD